MSVDIDYFTLHRLTEKAFKFDDEDKQQCYPTLLNLIRSKSPEDAAQSIIRYIDEQFSSRKLLFAVSTADPNAALKPKKKPFRRVGADDPNAVLPTITELTPEEIDRRQEAAKASSARITSFYKNAMMAVQEEDEGEDENLTEEEMEAILKNDILNSVMLAPEEETDNDPSNGVRYGIPLDSDDLHS